MYNFHKILSFYAEHRVLIVFFIILIALVIWLFAQKSGKKDADESLDERVKEVFEAPIDEERVAKILILEEQRKANSYKPGWLYYKCKERGWLKEYYKLRNERKIEYPFKIETRPCNARNKDVRLTIELVPSSCWFSNLRSIFCEERWRALKRMAYKRAGYVCEICGGRGEKWPVEAHEIWQYDDATNIQKLISIKALCPPCHQVKHFGLSEIEGRGDVARQHLMRINSWECKEADSYIDREFEIWSLRSDKSWRTDLSALTEYGILKEEIGLLEVKANAERTEPR